MAVRLGRYGPILLGLITIVSLVFVGSVAARPVAQGEAVQIQDFAFNPSSLTVPVGTEVTWTNNDPVPHTATARDGSFDTGRLEQGQSGSVTFDTAGTFEYFCQVHPTMVGTIIVEAVQEAPSPSPSPSHAMSHSPVPAMSPSPSPGASPSPSPAAGLPDTGANDNNMLVLSVLAICALLAGFGYSLARRASINS